MQSLRRVALRSATSAARATTPKAPASQFVGQFTAKNVVVKQSAVSLARYFSQTVRRANEEESRNEFQGSTSTSTAQAGEAKESTQQQGPVSPPNGIWVRNFVFDVNEDHLRELFSKFGTVTDVKIVRDPRGLSRGFGFVYMETQQQSDDAIAELNGSFWHGRRVHMERQLSKGPRTAGDGGKGPLRKAINFPSEPTRFLYIGNIPYEATDAELNRMFRGLENMEDVRVAVDRVTGFPRGFAHADFTDVESAKKAHEKLSGYTMGDRSLRIDYAGSSVQSRKSKTFDKE